MKTPTKLTIDRKTVATLSAKQSTQSKQAQGGKNEILSTSICPHICM